MHVTHALIAAYLNPFSTNRYLYTFNNNYKFIIKAENPPWTTEGHFLQDLLDNPDNIRKDRFDPSYNEDFGDIPGRLKEVADEMVSQDNLKLDDDANLELDNLFGDVPPTLKQPETFHPSLTDNSKSMIDELKNLPNLIDCAVPTERIKQHPDLINGMRYRKLGDSDLIVSELCLGTSFYDNPAFIDLDHANLIIEKAHKEYGINFFDTAEYDPLPIDPKSWKSYHHRAIKTLKKFNRSNIVISGRVCSGNFGKPHRQRYLAWTRSNLLPPTLNNIEEGVDNILIASGLDYLDIVSLDRPERYVPNSNLGEDTYCWGKEISENDMIMESIEALKKIIDKGKARYIGLSNETIWGVHKYSQLTKNDPKFKPVFIQNLYNILHRNEFETGLAEASLANNIPLVSYGTLAGGILTGKYLDPERNNSIGADKTPEKIYEYDDDHGILPEDWGHLSFGPQNARCNIFPDTYHTHRTVWCQHLTAEYLKIARTFGMTLSQLALKWNNTRHFNVSTIIAPRTIGQLLDSIGTLNYPFTKELEEDIHELYLRYRAPTMGGPQILTSVDDPENAVSQNKLITDYTTPIWSGGSYWPEIRVKDEHIERRNKLEAERNFLLTISGHMDSPNDRSKFNYRCWIERIEEDLPGEYFAVKESKLFGWDRYKFRDYTLVYKTPEEYREDDTSDFHFYWKDGKIYIGPTTDKIRSFYEDDVATSAIVQMRATEYINMVKDDVDFVRSFSSIDKGWASIDVDGLYKRLLNKGIDITDKSVIERLFDNEENKKLIELIENESSELCYYHQRMKSKKAEPPPPGMEDVADPVILDLDKTKPRVN